MFQTIKNKFVFLFMILVTVTIILIGIVSDFIIQRYITQEVTEVFYEDLKGEAAKLDTFIHGIKRDINLLSGDSIHNYVRALESGKKTTIDTWRSKLENKFVKYLEVKRIYSEIQYIDSSGQPLLIADFDGEKATISSEAVHDRDRKVFIDTMKLDEGMIHISPLSLERKNGRLKDPHTPIIHFAKPIFNDIGNRVGILIIDVRAGEFLKILKHDNSGNLMLLNKSGYFLVHQNQLLEFGFDINGRGMERLQKYYPDQAGKILTSDSGYVDTGRGWVTTWLYWFYNPGDELLVYRSYLPNSIDKTNYWVLVKAGNKKDLIDTLMTMRGLMLGISTIFFAITFPVILFFGFRLTKSISRLKKAMEGFENGEGMEVLDIKTQDEFSELTQSFVTMSESLYCTKMNLNSEFQRLKHLIEFSRLVGEEISEKECYQILVTYLSKSFYFDKVVAVSFNNSENLAETMVAFTGENGVLAPTNPSLVPLKVTNDARLCRASRSGHKFVVSDVESDYRCQHQECDQDKGSYGCFPVVTGGAVLGWVHLINYNKNYFTEDRCFMIESYINTIAPAINSIRLLNAHKKMSVQDPLTGLYNRRFLEEILDRQIAISDRYKQSLSVLMLDIDHFKKFNDTHGHAFGDKALVLVSEIISKSVRESDTVARYGGEEFIVVLPNTGLDAAAKLADKLRVAVQECTVTNDNGGSEGVTISLGVSCYPHIAQTLQELVDTADAALYQSKARGRNMVTKAEVGSNTAIEIKGTPDSIK